MTVFYAQLYDISACGFYFSDMEEYDTKFSKCRNSFGGQIEKLEIQFIDGESIDAQFFKTLSFHPGNISHFIEAVDKWEEYEKQALIITVGECGYDFDITDNDLSVIENVDIYRVVACAIWLNCSLMKDCMEGFRKACNSMLITMR